MDILGIGPLELVFILIIALIVLGPKDMVKAGQTIGKFLRQIVTSPTWHAVTKTSTELRNLPTKLIRDAGLEEDLKQLEDVTKSAIPPSLNQDLSKWQEDVNSWTTPPAGTSQSADEVSAEIEDNTIGTKSEDDSLNTIGNEVSEPPESSSHDSESQENQEQVD